MEARLGCTLESSLPLESRIGLAAEELAGAGAADEFSRVDDGAAAGENGLGRALNLDALEHRVIHAHVMRFGADDFFLIGIEEDKIGIRADGDRSFARSEERRVGKECRSRV